jgi:ATP-dependent helicase HrpA
MLCARIEPGWIEQQAAHLVNRTWRDAHWSRKRGAVLAFEQVTLFGLTLVEKRSVQFGNQDLNLAHEVFLREALARGDLDSRADCVRANIRVLEQAHELEAKRRRAGLVKDEDALVEFFRGKLPVEISTAAAFDAWYRRASASEQAALHWSLDFVLASEPGLRASDFPTHLDITGHTLRLEYRFVPGDPADGVAGASGVRQRCTGRALRVACPRHAAGQGCRADPRIAEVAAPQLRARARFRPGLRPSRGAAR